MSEHTPGPWRWLNGNVLMGDHGNRPVVLASPQLDMRSSDGILVRNDPESPNARLIAAAPELLSALTAFLARYVELVNSGDCGKWNAEQEDFVIAARAAIAKSEGQP